MPSAKILSEKQAYVADLKAKFESAVSGCVVAYGGINVENDTKLRKELREAGVDYMVVKNTMLRLAVKGTLWRVWQRTSRATPLSLLLTKRIPWLLPASCASIRMAISPRSSS